MEVLVNELLKEDDWFLTIELPKLNFKHYSRFKVKNYYYEDYFLYLVSEDGAEVSFPVNSLIEEDPQGYIIMTDTAVITFGKI